MGLILLVVMFAIVYMFMVRPQQKKVQAQRELLGSLEVGDVVVTSAGIHGAVAEIEDTVVWLEVAPEVELKVSKAAITELVEDPDEVEDEAELEAADSSDDET